MDKKILISQLSDIGFHEKEADLYISLLEIGEGTTSQIAKNTNINRVTAYGVLEDMIAKGYIIPGKTDGVKSYIPISPEVIIKDYQDKLSNIQKNMPILTSLYGNKAQKPKVRFFQGIRGVKKAYEEVLTSKTDICNYANFKTRKKLWPGYQKDFVQKRVSKKIFLKGLFPDSEIGKKAQERDSKLHRETRLLEEVYFSESYEIKLFDDKILLATFEDDPYAVIIESTVFYKTQKQIFELVWRNAHPKE